LHLHHRTILFFEIRNPYPSAYQTSSENIAPSIFPYRGRCLPLQGNIFSPVGENTESYAFGYLKHYPGTTYGT